jgi:hypothetical protein
MIDLMLLLTLVGLITAAGLMVAYYSWRHVTLWTLAIVIVVGMLLVLLTPAHARVQAAGLVLAFGPPTVLALALASSPVANRRLWVVAIGVPPLWLLTYLATLSIAVSHGLLSP